MRITVNDHALHLVELDDEDIINASVVMSRLARKKNPPVSGAMEEAEYIGLRLMTGAEYSHPKNLGEFDLKTSS